MTMWRGRGGGFNIKDGCARKTTGEDSDANGHRNTNGWILTTLAVIWSRDIVVPGYVVGCFVVVVKLI